MANSFSALKLPFGSFWLTMAIQQTAVADSCFCRIAPSMTQTRKTVTSVVVPIAANGQPMASLLIIVLVYEHEHVYRQSSTRRFKFGEKKTYETAKQMANDLVCTERTKSKENCHSRHSRNGQLHCFNNNNNQYGDAIVHINMPARR